MNVAGSPETAFAGHAFDRIIIFFLVVVVVVSVVAIDDVVESEPSLVLFIETALVVWIMTVGGPLTNGVGGDDLSFDGFSREK